MMQRDRYDLNSFFFFFSERGPFLAIFFSFVITIRPVGHTRVATLVATIVAKMQKRKRSIPPPGIETFSVSAVTSRFRAHYRD